MSIYFIISTLFCRAALAIVYWIHSQARLNLQSPARNGRGFLLLCRLSNYRLTKIY
jgi:hypothetical protein